MRLQAAENLIETVSLSESVKAGLRGRIAAIRAYIAARMGDTSRIIQFAKRALSCLPQKDMMWRSVAATTLGFGYGWVGAGDLVKAHHAFSEARKMSQVAGNLYYQVFAGSCLAAVMLMQAQLKAAKVLSQKMLMKIPKTVFLLPMSKKYCPFLKAARHQKSKVKSTR